MSPFATETVEAQRRADLPRIILQARGGAGSELRCSNSLGKAIWTSAKRRHCSNSSKKEERGEVEGKERERHKRIGGREGRRGGAGKWRKRSTFDENLNLEVPSLQDLVPN